MKNSKIEDAPLWGLVKELADGGKCFVKEEIQLVKTELTEKATQFGRTAVGVAVGGLIAFAGLIAVLFSAGLFATLLFEHLGMERLLAAATGLGSAGLLVCVLGAVFVLNGIKSFSKQTLAPEKTIETLADLKGKRVTVRPKPEDWRGSTEIQESVHAIEQNLADVVEELGRRVTLRRAREHALADIRAHPVRWSVAAIGTGLMAGFFLKLKRLKTLIKGAALVARAV